MLNGFQSVVLCVLIFVVSRGVASEVAFDRIVHGWTNYSTAFLATHDSNSGDYASVAAYYTPDADAYLREFEVIVISDRAPGEPVDWSQFTFVVGIWSGLRAFTNSPASPDAGRFNFVAPTGGIHPDAMTRGGRSAYELRFTATNHTALLTAAHTYLVGCFARCSSSANGELYVPTSSHAGDSDVQAGNTIIGGWLNIADAGGSTIYFGELAMQLLIDSAAPPLSISRDADWLMLAWPAIYEGFDVQAAIDFPTGGWTTVSQWRVITNDSNVARIALPNRPTIFRLRKP